MSRRTAYIRKWNALSAFEKRCFIRAFVSLTWIGLLLKLLPFRHFKSFYTRVSHAFEHSRETLTQEQVTSLCRAVRVVANMHPLTLLCLPQALSVNFLMFGTPRLTLQIGVQKGVASGFEAHAWVELDGRIIIGDLPEMTYQPLWIWQK